MEGTVVVNGCERTPRPGLGGFLEFLLKHVHRTFVYTTLTAEETEEVFRHLFSEGHVPRRSEDLFKNLRRCRFPCKGTGSSTIRKR